MSVTNNRLTWWGLSRPVLCDNMKALIKVLTHYSSKLAREEATRSSPSCALDWILSSKAVLKQLETDIKEMICKQCLSPPFKSIEDTGSTNSARTDRRSSTSDYLKSLEREFSDLHHPSFSHSCHWSSRWCNGPSWWALRGTGRNLVWSRSRSMYQVCSQRLSSEFQRALAVRQVKGFQTPECGYSHKKATALPF